VTELLENIAQAARDVAHQQARRSATDEAVRKPSGFSDELSDRKASPGSPVPNFDMGRRGPTQADILIKLAQSAELLHAPDGTGFADLDINGHWETWPIRGKAFGRWLARRFFEATQGAPCSEAMQSVLNVIEARAHFDAPERIVHIRVGGLDGRLYLDLCDTTWRAVEIDTNGWRVIDRPPVRFRRAAGMKPLPMPVAQRHKLTINQRSSAESNSAIPKFRPRAGRRFC
jgi:hypothetical protein